MRYLLGLTVVFTLACAGPGGQKSAPTIRRIDFSHVDGISCMTTPRRGLLLSLDKPYTYEECGPRSREAYKTERARSGGSRIECTLGWSGECCEQAGGTLVGWEGHTLKGELLASPLCRFD